MRKRSVFTIFLLSIFILMFAACSDSSDPNETFTLSGTIVKSDVPDGTYTYMKLVEEESDVMAQPMYSATVIINSGSADYSVSGISEGEYSLYAFIDMNGNASESVIALPDAGDYVTATEVVIDRDIELSPSEDDWVEY